MSERLRRAARRSAVGCCLAAAAVTANLSAAQEANPKRSAADFQTLFGAEGEATLRALSAGKATECTAAVAQCATRLSAQSEKLLAAWKSEQGEESEPSASPEVAKPAKRTSTARGLNAQQRDELAALVQAAATWQLVQVIQSAPEVERAAIAGEFLDSPKFARALALVVEPSREDPAKVLRVARVLMADRHEALAQFPELAAAVSVVHDAPVMVQVNENIAQGCGPVPTFDYFATNQRKSNFGIKGLAPEVLIFVVDVAASIDELAWASKTFGGHPSVGALYDQVEYDFDHLEKGRPKKVTVAGWSLVNVMRFGGVCADQAHFAVTIGKAIGVPCAYTSATDGVLSHAWVGFVAKTRGGPSWQETGRFGGYASVEGFIQDPQTGLQVSNTQMPMLVRYGAEPEAARLASAALRIAAAKLIGNRTVPPTGAATSPAPDAATSPAPDAAAPSPSRDQGVDSALALLRIAVQACMTDARSWELIGRAAASGAMTREQKEQWSADILELCGASYPEFAWRTISPMISSISDITERQKALDAALTIFRDRGDLAGQILLQQAALYTVQGNASGAGHCYEMILNRYFDDGPFAIVALEEASALLAAQNNSEGNILLHERAFRVMEAPKSISPQFARQSNWWRTGVRLAEAYRLAGRERDAAFVEQRIIDVTK